MPLSRDAIEELKRIHYAKTGESLNDAEAFEMGNRLVRLFRILIRPPEAKRDILYGGSDSLAFDQRVRNRP